MLQTTLCLQIWNLDEIDKVFLKCNLPKLTQKEKKNHLKSLNQNFKNFFTNNTFGLHDFMGKFYQAFVEQVIPNLDTNSRELKNWHEVQNFPWPRHVGRQL